MSWEVVRCPGFWNRVNSASSSRTMITQRAKLRKLAFIPCPSWLPQAPQPVHTATYGPIQGRHRYNLGAGGAPAKGTRSIPFTILPPPRGGFRQLFQLPNRACGPGPAGRGTLDRQPGTAQGDQRSRQGAAPVRRVVGIRTLQRLVEGLELAELERSLLAGAS